MTKNIIFAIIRFDILANVTNFDVMLPVR